MATSSTSDDENKLDFDTLKRQLAATNLFARTNSSSNSSRSTIDSNLGASDIDVWPLQLNTTLLDHYILGDNIGSGSYAEVRECVDTRTLQRCAVKIVNKHYLKRQAPNALRNQLQEIQLLRGFDCVNIISMKECLFKGTKIYIFLEHCSFVLNDLLNEQPTNRFCVQFSKYLFKQLINGLDYLHSRGIVHRDIKPQNLLIANCGTLKIIDFGVSQILSMWSQDDLCSNYEGSPLFQAPEIVVGQIKEYSGFKVDVWSAGVTLYLMLFGEYPFNDEALLGLYDKILSQELRFPLDRIEREQQTLVSDLLSSMLDKLSKRRATLDEIQSHPWLNWRARESRDAPDKPSCRYEVFSSAQPSEMAELKGDIYRSMSVLPYLHNYHFPDLPVMKVKQAPSSLLPSASSSATSSPCRVSPRANLSPAPVPPPPPSTNNSSEDAATWSSSSSVDPHQMIHNRPVEWGTERQYKLLKVPQIRANRLKRRRRQQQQQRRA